MKPRIAARLLFAVLLAAAPAAAQQAPPDAAPSDAVPPSPAPQLIADENGFLLAGPEGRYALRLRGEMQTDARFFVGGSADQGADTFYLRRVRAAFQGTLAGSFDFLLRADFGQGRAELLDAYLDARLLPGMSLQAGKLKAPVGLERLLAAADRTFIELSFPTSLLPNRDVGVILHGEWFGRRLEYQAGLFNGVVDGSSGDVDTSDGKDLAARLFARPFAASPAGVLKGLGFGIAATTGTQHGDAATPGLASYRTSARQTFFRYRTGADLAATALAGGRRTRIAPQASYYHGPFGLTAEYARSTAHVERGDAAADLVAEAAHVTAGLLLTGEAATFKRLRPKQPFDRSKGQWGAFEIAGRLQAIRMDAAAFPTFADPARSARGAFAWAVGVNWYLTPNVRFAVNYERTTFDAAEGGVRLAPESLLLSRVQLSF